MGTVPIGQQRWEVIDGPGPAREPRDQPRRAHPADSLTADFQNVNRAMKMAPFTGASNQTWSQFAA